MTPAEFIKKWKPVALTERAAAHTHFLDLCKLFEHDDPVSADPTGEWFAFEKGATKTGGGEGFADVWKKNFFAWEYKKKKRNLDVAMEQLVRYAAALENPPLQVVCDTERFVIRTAWTNTVPKQYEIELDDLALPEKREILWAVFHDPERLRPKETRAGVTREAADKFSTIALRLQGRGRPEDVAHFVNQLVFCFFASSVKLLPDGFFPKLLKRAAQKPDRAQDYFNSLFEAMEHGGEFDLTDIAHFNGGLFDGRRALHLEDGDIGLLIAAGSLDWSLIDPTIFGTLFERFLDPDKRAQIGAHYTDPDKIMMIVDPVILRPLRAEWEIAKREIVSIADEANKLQQTQFSKSGARSFDRQITAIRAKAELARDKFLERLRKVSILDPACGSGNFLYLALQGVKDIELKANLECEALGLAPRVPVIGPEIVHGIEINPLAAELARTTIWIGDIQWRLRNGIYARPDPILRKLDAIECRDALITKVSPPLESAEASRSRSLPSDSQSSPQPQTSPLTQASSETPASPQARTSPQTQTSPPGLTRGSISSSKTMDRRVKPGDDDSEERYVEAEWPAAEFIVGNPPFLGVKKMIAGLGEVYAGTIRAVYAGRIDDFSDLVCWWFEKARSQLVSRRASRVGLVATNSIRGGKNRVVLDKIVQTSRIFEAWSDEAWIVDGASVRVSIVCFSTSNQDSQLLLNGRSVQRINSDLSPSETDVTQAKKLFENLSVGFGVQKTGPFDLVSSQAREWLIEPQNINGKYNADVLRPYLNGSDITRRSRDVWIIDFGGTVDEKQAAAFQSPFQYAKSVVKPVRQTNKEQSARDLWWRHWRPRPELSRAASKLNRVIVTPRVSKHRLFVWVHPRVLPDSATVAIAREDNTSFGILHSRFHEAWTLRLCTWLGVGNDPRYTPTTTFETFPFPEGLTPNIPAEDYEADPRAQAIAATAKRLDDLRNAWLNPPDLVVIEPEVVPGYPDRILPKDAQAAVTLKTRTLTNLYNQRPQWLADAHRDLDAAVAAAYGWPADISEEDALARLLELNLARAGAAAAPDVISPDDED